MRFGIYGPITVAYIAIICACLTSLPGQIAALFVFSLLPLPVYILALYKIRQMERNASLRLPSLSHAVWFTLKFWLFFGFVAFCSRNDPNGIKEVLFGGFFVYFFAAPFALFVPWYDQSSTTPRGFLERSITYRARTLHAGKPNEFAPEVTSTPKFGQRKRIINLAKQAVYIKDKYYAGKADELDPPMTKNPAYIMMCEFYRTKNPEFGPSVELNPDDVFRSFFQESVLPPK